MNIVLIGYRGSGKTTIGRNLATHLWKTFLDVDREACRRFGIDSIAEIWDRYGEPAWREMEVKVVQDAMRGDDQVIALGGGTLMQPEAREAVESADNVQRIYLYCKAEELNRRIEADPVSAATRPSLTAHGGGVDEIRAVLAEREPVYRAVADHEFDVTHVTPEEAVRHLLSRYL
ncbi:MAG: shikimate kinase [Phycisphaeraceae bacterium]